ncbi:ABC transporter substrate-binding protein [Streptomyces sp. NPDC057638]|uniref:ABC transporter substrate-binding protein n=1 Tax=Streptomyces sp. NPDC057638 TaxID=3346190 RepID=UPI0036B2366F
MRSIRPRVLLVSLVVATIAAAAVGAWLLLPAERRNEAPITVGTTDVVTSLDPAGAYDVGSWAMFGNIYQTLLTIRPGTATPVPDAARSCGFTGTELRTYVCELRDGLRFPSGREVTAEDVEFSISRLRTIRSEVGPAPLFATLASVTATGRTVRFQLSTGDATFPQKLATGAGSIVDRTRYSARRLRDDPAADGSGPFRLKEYVAGAHARLVPNPTYRGAARKPEAPVVVRYYAGAERLATAWRTGQLHVSHRQLPAAVIAGLDLADAGLRVTEAQSAEIRMLVFNVRPGSPLKRAPVRRAVAALVDRGRLAGGVHHSTVQPLYSLIPKGVLAHSNPFLDQYPLPSAAVARELLERAGVETPVPFTLAHRADSGPALEAAELKRQLEADGLFRVTVRAKAWTDFQQGYARGEYDAFTLGWIPDFPDPDSFTQPLVSRHSTLRNGYRSAAVEKLIAATQREDVRSRTARDFTAIQQRVARDVPLVPLWQRKDYVLSTRQIGGSQYLTDGTGLWRLWQLKRL